MKSLNGSSHAVSAKRAARFALWLLAALPAPALCQILDVRDLTATDIRSLDRERTVVILQGGILEEHGPYLPVYTDGWGTEYLTAELAKAIVARPGWKAVVFPVIPLGSGGANEIGRKFNFSGTFAVRPATLRAVYMDLAAVLGDQRFRWVFVVSGHGGPSHSRALFDVCDFYRDVYGYTMAHLAGLAPVSEWLQKGPQFWSEEARRENGMGLHADMVETSIMLYLRPSAVQSTYTAARSLPTPAMSDAVRWAGQPDWQGYLGAPRFATVSHGAQIIQDIGARITKLALEILDGADARKIGRYTDMFKGVPEQNQIDTAAAAHDADVERKQNDWLKRHNR